MVMVNSAILCIDNTGVKLVKVIKWLVCRHRRKANLEDFIWILYKMKMKDLEKQLLNLRSNMYIYSNIILSKYYMLKVVEINERKNLVNYYMTTKKNLFREEYKIIIGCNVKIEEVRVGNIWSEDIRVKKRSTAILFFSKVFYFDRFRIRVNFYREEIQLFLKGTTQYQYFNKDLLLKSDITEDWNSIKVDDYNTLISEEKKVRIFTKGNDMIKPVSVRFDNVFKECLMENEFIKMNFDIYIDNHRRRVICCVYIDNMLIMVLEDSIWIFNIEDEIRLDLKNDLENSLLKAYLKTADKLLWK